jgi:signal transduction histidine kinase
MRKRHDITLRENQARLASGADLAGLAFYDLDVSSGVMYADDRLRDLCGVPPDRQQGLQVLEFWSEHLHPEDRPRILDLREQLQDGRLARLSLEYRYRHPVCGQKWFHHIAGVAERDEAGRALRCFGVIRDVTDLKRTEDELRDLSRRLIRAHEEERALLARELHDDVSQRLAVLAIDVSRNESAAADRSQATTMRGVREELVRLSDDIHSLAYQLHPSVLEDLGLAEALRSECERRDRLGRLTLSVDVEPLSVPIGHEASLCLFRVAQEALNNVTRHADTGVASVALRQMNGGVLLTVRDGGRGFDAEHPDGGRSLGLASMRERVRLAHGTLDIESAPGRGTTVVAWVPAAHTAT